MTPFDIVLVRFPFTDLSTSKQRPCFVLTCFQPKGLTQHAVVSMITSQIDGLSFNGDIMIKDWKKSGLPKPSLIRLSKLVTIETTIVKKKLGSLVYAERKAVSAAFKSLFKEML